MKLAIITSGLAAGGAETMLLRVLQGLDKRRFSPYVISLTTLGEIGSHIAALGVPVKAIGMTNNSSNVPQLLALMRELKALQPDVVHTWMYHADLIGGVAARLVGMSRVAWGIRNSNLDRTKTKRSTRAVVKLCALLSRWIPRRILTCSEVARRIHIEIGYDASKMVVVPNGVDLATFKPDPAARVSVCKEVGIPSNALLVGLIGRFDLQKNHEGFFRAMRMVSERVPSVRCLLAGQGVDRSNPTLMRLVRDAEVEQIVHLLGLRNDIPFLMAALDVLVSSSLYGEAFPNVVAEAMACGVACVVTDVGDSAHIVGNCGSVVAPGDISGLAEAVEAQLILPAVSRRLEGQRARHRVAELFEISNVVRQYEAFYESIARP